MRYINILTFDLQFFISKHAFLDINFRRRRNYIVSWKRRDDYWLLTTRILNFLFLDLYVLNEKKKLVRPLKVKQVIMLIVNLATCTVTNLFISPIWKKKKKLPGHLVKVGRVNPWYFIFIAQHTRIFSFFSFRYLPFI